MINIAEAAPTGVVAKSACILLAWELGSNFGHLFRLMAIGSALKIRGHKVVYVVCDISAAKKVLSITDHVLQCPKTSKHSGNGSPTSMADILANVGYDSNDALGKLVADWITLLQEITPGCMVTEYAPTAGLSARLLAIPCLQIASGFDLPPQTEPMPSFRLWEQTNVPNLLAKESALLKNINGVCESFGGARLSRLCELFPQDNAFLTTWPELDHYQRDHARYIGPIFHLTYGEPVNWPTHTDKTRILVYLRPSSRLSMVLAQLSQLDATIIAVIPGISPALRLQFSTQHFLIATHPIRLIDVIKTASIAISYGGHGFVATALAHGVPILLLPTNVEQYLLAKRVHEQGLGIALSPMEVPEKLQTSIELLHGRPMYRNRAITLAGKYVNYRPDDAISLVVDAIESRISRAACN